MISADGSFILIKVGEALAVPEDKKNLTSLKYETNQADVDNTHLNLDIRTDLNFDFEQRQNETDGNVIGNPDWEAGMPTDILNGDGFTNTEVSKIVSDNHRPGNKELHDDSLSINFNNNLDNIYNNQQNNSIFNPNYDPFQNIFSDLLKNTGLYGGKENIINIDPLVADLNGDGVKLTHYNNSKAEFDVDNDGYAENTGWVDNNDGIIEVY